MKLRAGTGSSLIPQGTYAAILQKIEEKRNTEGSYLLWTFGVSSQGEAKTVTGVTPMHLDPGSKARFWSEALLGRQLQENEEVDLEQLYGRTCRIELTQVEKDGRTYPRISRVTKSGGLKLKTTQGPVPEEEEEVGDHPF